MLTHEALAAAAERHIRSNHADWTVEILILVDPAGAFARPRHVTGADFTGSPPPFFVDASDGSVTRLFPSPAVKLLVEWTKAGVPGAEAFAAGDDRASLPVLSAFIKAALREAEPRYRALRVPTIDELRSQAV